MTVSALPTLIERDANLPPLGALVNEATRAQRVLTEGCHAAR